MAFAQPPQTAMPQTDKIVRQSFDYDGRARPYYVYAPAGAGPDAPLLLALHGSGMDGRSVVSEWKEVARKEGLIVVGPDSSSGFGWSLKADGAGFMRGLVETLRGKLSFDPRRLYLFGYSAGAVYALQLSMIESDYFAAAAVYAGAMDPSTYKNMGQARRKIPIAIFVSTNDPFFPAAKVQATRNALRENGFPVYLKEVSVDDSSFGHDYGTVAGQVNRESWQFLRGYRLEAEPPRVQAVTEGRPPRGLLPA